MIGGQQKYLLLIGHFLLPDEVQILERVTPVPVHVASACLLTRTRRAHHAHGCPWNHQGLPIAQGCSRLNAQSLNRKSEFVKSHCVFVSIRSFHFYSRISVPTFKE